MEHLNYFEGDLVIRCSDRVESINSRFDDRVQSTFRSWQICRLMRRDFNYIQAKMYFAMLDHKYTDKIHYLLADIQDECQLIEDMARKFELCPDIPEVALPFRLISEEGRTLHDSIMSLDKPVAKFLGEGLKDQIQEDLSPVITAIHRLKKFLIECDRTRVEKRSDHKNSKN